MCKFLESPRSFRSASVTTASNLTNEQEDKAVTALLADVLNSIDRAVAGAAQNEAGVALAPTDTSRTPHRSNVAASQ